MNWFKKVFKQFVSEEDELNQVEETVEEFDQPDKESTAWKKEMDSKVIYQYPKGNFRFPLIPDGDEDNRKEIERKKRRETRQTFEEDRQEDISLFNRPSVEQPKKMCWKNNHQIHIVQIGLSSQQKLFRRYMDIIAQKEMWKVKKRALKSRNL